MSNHKHFLVVLKDMVLYGAVGASTQFANLLLLPLLTRLFSTKEYGAIDIVTVSSALATLFMTLCLPSGLIRFFHEKAPTARDTMISSLFLFTLGISAALCLALYLVTPFIIEHTVRNPLYITFFRLGWIAAAVSAPCNILGALLRSERRIFRYGIVNLTTFLSQIALSVVLVIVFHAGISGILWGSILSGALGLALAVIFTWPHLSVRFSWGVCREVLSYCLPLVPALLTNWVNQRGTRYVILFYLTLSEAGIYGVGVLLAGVVSFIASSFQNSWNPYVITLFKHESFGEINRRILLFYTGGIIAFALCFEAAIKEICLFALDRHYLSAIPIVPWLIGGFILQGSGNITSVGVTVSKRTSLNSLAAWSGVALNLILSVVLTPYWGLQGVAASYFFSQFLYTSILIVATHRLHPVRFDLTQQVALISVFLILSHAILWLTLNRDGFLLRYLLAVAGSALIIRYLNIAKPLWAALKHRIPMKRWARAEG